MRNWIKRFLSPPLFPDEKKTRQASATQAILAAYVMIGVCSFAAVPFVRIPWVFGVLFLLTAIACLVCIFALVKRGAVRAASLLFPIVLWSSLFLLGLFGGGILSLAFPLLGLVILISSLLSGARYDVVFMLLNSLAGALFYFLGTRGRLPLPVIPSTPLTLWIGATVGWVLISTGVFLSRRGPLDIIAGENQRNRFLVEQTAELKREISQRREAELVAESRATSLLAASKMAIECATAPRGTDPLKLIAEQIHTVARAVATVVSTFDPERSELRVKYVVIREPLRTIAEKIMGLDPSATLVAVPPDYGQEVIRGGILITEDLTEATFGRVPPLVASALKKALNMESFMGIGLVDGDQILATVLVGLAPQTQPLSPEVREIFSTVATMLLRQDKTEAVARDQESRFTEMIDQLPQPVLETDAVGDVVFANQAANEVFGIDSSRDTTRSPFSDLFAPEDRRKAETELASLTAFHPQSQMQYTLVRKDGARFPAIVTARVMMKANRVHGVRGVVSDISSIRRAEERLSESEQMLRLVLDLIPLPIFWKDRDGLYLGCNHSFSQRAGFVSPSAVVGTTDDDMPWHALSNNAKLTESKIIATGEPQLNFEVTMDSARGENRRVRLSKFPLRNAHGDVLGVLGFTEDITDWVNNEATRNLLTTAIEQAAESVVITDSSGSIQYVNSAFLKNYGYTREEVVGQNPRILKGGRYGENFFQDMWAIITSGKVWHGRFHNVRKDHSTILEEAIISPVLDPSGTTSQFVKVARDVTYEVDLEKRFQQSQKMEAVGRLAGGVAHDFNNILTVISGYGEILMHMMGKDGKWKEELGAIVEASARASALTGQLLTFSRKQMLEPQVCDLNAVLRGIEGMLRRLIGEDISLSVELDPTPVPVFVDRGQIEQVILNLAVNARDAMPKGGRLSLQSQRRGLNPQLLETHPTATQDDYAVLEVSDSGIGMTEEVKAHIYEPFFTTKSEHKGTGLGLATVYGIVTQSEGFIEVDTKPGEGTRFSIFFPISKQIETTKAKSMQKENVAGKGERVLLVEDDIAIRKLLQRSLLENGFFVTVVASAAEALEVFHSSRESHRILLTDVVMPGTSGPDLAELLRSEQPSLKVLFISGYTANETSEYGIWGNEINLLQKPFSMKDLVRRMRETLDND